MSIISVNVFEDQPNLSNKITPKSKFTASTIANIFYQLERLGYSEFSFSIETKFNDKKIILNANREENVKDRIKNERKTQEEINNILKIGKLKQKLESR